MLTVAAREARWTQTGEGVDAVHTGAAIEAGAGGRRAAGERVTGAAGPRPDRHLCAGLSSLAQTVAKGAWQPPQARSSLIDLREANRSRRRPPAWGQGLCLSNHITPPASVFLISHSGRSFLSHTHVKNKREARTCRENVEDNYVTKQGQRQC